MAAFVILATVIIVLVLILSLHEKSTNAKCESQKRLDGRVVVVTGGTAGIGVEVATDMAKRGARVIIAGPFKEEGENAEKLIKKRSGNEKVIFKLLDLASLSSVRQLAKDILQTEDRLDILVNNAGVGVPVNSKSVNETNYIMHVNFFGHFLLTILLLPILKKTGKPSTPSRVVNLSSFLSWYGKFEHTNLGREDFFYRFQCYCNSKFSLVLFGHELSKKLKGHYVVVNAVDPGLVGTAIYESFHKVIGFFVKLFLRWCCKTPVEGAQTTLHVALDDDAGDVTGQFFKNCKLTKAKTTAYDDNLGKELWDTSIKMVKMDANELEQCIK